MKGKSDMTVKIQPGMFITTTTLQKLGPIRYQFFRDILRSQGYSVSDSFGAYTDYASPADCIRLYSSGDLAWSARSLHREELYELTIDQLESLISSHIKVKFDPKASITNSIQSSDMTDLPDDVDDLTIEQLAQYVQRLKNKRERLDAEINKCKQLLIQKLE